MHGTRGTSLVEILVACMLFAVGLLGLAATSAALTRLVARGQRAAAAAHWAAGRLEQLRLTACSGPVTGQDEMQQGGTLIGRLTWTVTQHTPDAWSAVLVARHMTASGRWRVDTMETRGSCT